MINSFADMAGKSTFALPSQNTTDTTTSTTSTTTGTTSSTTDRADYISEEFNTFLTLLTAQVENQDPLEPIDSTQFVEQLATFSALEQQVMTNDNLEGIAGLINDMNTLIANEWLGQDVAVKSSWLPSSGEATEFKIDTPPEQADESVLTIRDSSGNVLNTEALKPGISNYVWDNKTSNGASIAENTLLNVSVDHYQDGQLIAKEQPGIVTQVTGVAETEGKLQLTTAAKLSGNVETVEKLN